MQPGDHTGPYQPADTPTAERFAPGTVLAGRYHIEELLGRGGMGSVWRARDDTLGRAVAVKVVRGPLADSAEGLTRLNREARLLAALNHPHIATLHSLETDASLRFLVMELVPGPTLAERLARGPLPVAEALPLAAQLADALAAAHGQGIIHRDLKPANLKLTPEGRLKVLDFGLAYQPDAPATTEAAISSPGTVVGTAAYMSPEQAAGEPADKRTDIWAFGSVLFEMLAGRRAFPGPFASDTLAAVLKGEPDWPAFPTGVPPRLRLLVEHCLRRNPRHRLHDLADARIELEDLASAPTEPFLIPPRPTRRRALLALAGLGIGAAGVAAGVAASRWWPRPETPTEWTGELLLTGALGPHGPEISPDGQWLAFRQFVGEITQVGVMRLASGDHKVLTTDRTHRMVTHLCWSPDSARIYYVRLSLAGLAGVFSVPIGGGPEQPVLPRADNPQPLPDGTLLAHRREADGSHRIVRYWPNDGTVKVLEPAIEILQTERFSLRAFPDGQEVVFWKKPPADTSDVAVQLCALHLATGVERVLHPSHRRGSFPSLALDPAGQAVYIASSEGPSSQVVVVPRSASGPPRVVLTRPGTCFGLSVGSDGSVFIDLVTRWFEMLRFAQSGGAPERFGWTGAGERDAPLLLPDGRILYSDVIGARHRVLALATGQDSQPFVQTDQETWLPAAVLDRERVVLPIGPADRRDLAVVSIADGRILPGRRLIQWDGPLISLAASPDGRTIWFVSRHVVWVLRQGPDGPLPFCDGESAALSADGRVLYVVETTRRLMRWPVAGGPAEDVPVCAPFQLHYFALAGSAAHRDGRLAVLVNAPDSYFNIPAVLDPASGNLEPIRLDYAGDLFNSSWTGDGKLMATGIPWQSALWRFRPTAKGGPSPS